MKIQKKLCYSVAALAEIVAEHERQCSPNHAITIRVASFQLNGKALPEEISRTLQSLEFMLIANYEAVEEEGFYYPDAVEPVVEETPAANGNGKRKVKEAE